MRWDENDNVITVPSYTQCNMPLLHTVIAQRYAIECVIHEDALRQIDIYKRDIPK